MRFKGYLPSIIFIGLTCAFIQTLPWKNAPVCAAGLFYDVWWTNEEIY